MNWFKGEIVEAITKSRSENAIFVVYVEGKDDKSTELTKLLDTEKVSSKLGSGSFVAIKLEANSVPHQQFSEIYKQTPVPSIYFIGKQGSPLEIITEAQDPETLSKTLDSICQKGGVAICDTGAAASSSLINSEQSSSGPSNVVCENGVCTIKKDSNQLSQEEKVEKAKKLVEIKREEKKRQEEEQDRLKEIERRKMGQNVQQLKQWQEDQKLKQLLEEREKEKRENQEAHDRVLAQIAQDKAERAARAAAAEAPSTSHQSSPRPQPAPQQQRSPPNVARIQFRMPDGSSNTHDFPASDTLDSLFSYIRDDLNFTSTSFALSTTFPRRQFTEQDRDSTLLDLDLAPSSVILILPLNRGTVATGGGYNWMDIVWNLLAPFFTIYGYIRNFILGTPDEPAENKRAADGPSEQRPRPKRRLGESSVVRRLGNVHGLANRDDSDDENNTWNGNSTQQM